MMQGQSSRALKGPNSTNYPPFISMPSERKDPNNLKITKFGTMGSVLNDFPLCAPSCEMGLDEADHDTVAWPNFPIVEPFNDDYCPNFLHELGFAGNENNLASLVQTRNSPQLKAPSIQQDSTSKVLSSVTEVNKFKISEYSPLMHSEHPLPRRGHSDITHSDAGTANRMDLRSSGCCSSPVGGSMGSKLNFPYFSRFAPLSGTFSGDVLSSKQRTCNNIRGDIINSHNPVKSTLVNSSEVKLSMTSKLDTLPPLQSEALCRKAGENDKYVDQPFDAVPTEVMEGHGQIPEPSVPPSSVCSGNRLNRTSNDRAYSLKRKFQEMGDSDGPSDEAEEESVEDRKITFGYTRSKKSRAAEVHNLSERRRRERINEKMRVLQELIPNCNKVDKASMLDETIEYLKSLQLQVQILSMGTGMYAPPMMLPAAIQHIHRAHMPQFLPMGMGLSSGMGMYDVNYGMTPVPNIQSPCYPLPGPSVSTTPMFHGAVGYSHQCLGPGQEQLMSMPHVPPPFFGSSPTRLPVGHVSTMPGIVDLPLLAPSPSSKEMVPNGCSEKMPDDRANTNEDSG